MNKIICLFFAIFLSACSSRALNPINWVSAYQMPIEQGNAVSEAAVKQVQIGMTRQQVQFLLGTPLLQDPFHKNQWVYVYYLDKQGQKTTEHRFSVFFNNDVVERLDGQGEAASASNN